MDKRSAGILMHISSLPSAFGIGDLGPAAKEFADFLFRSSQSVWQVLPLNPTSSQQGYSPYSSCSSMAGNPLFISPEILFDQGLLSREDMEIIRESLGHADFENTEESRKRMLTIAYNRYRIHEESSLREQFHSFCEKENYWLNDFALYTVIREKQYNLPWYEWHVEFKDRHSNTLIRFQSDHKDDMEEVKFSQMLFHRQWQALKTYCSKLNIHLLGDLPFYVAHDSADVWAHRDIFSLDESGMPLKIAGVPPDAFNDNGQLWGMPVFKWNLLKERNYDWWICRLKKNLEWFDEIRLDHFRAFSQYWEVEANRDSAITGEWTPGPGADFFSVIKKELRGLPFVAEDLGEIDDSVYELRDQFNLPGMNVLQFAFGDDMPENTYIPHHQHRNSIVYTGTHDNNTTVGWFRSLDKRQIKNLTLYTGMKVNKNNVSEILGRMAYAAVANRVIIPMQDILGLDADARMNTPSSQGKNWRWRMHHGAPDEKTETKLRDWCFLYDRKMKAPAGEAAKRIST